MAETIVIKGVDAEAYLNFKGEAMKAGLKMGEAASQAFRLWVRHQTEPSVVRTDRRLSLCAAIDGIRGQMKQNDEWDSSEVIRAWRDVRGRP